ncbi:B12-binding domain-containing radical SAM protein, partial [bacterium]|nr:B12-binding domain-containing radical SAM protein [bacterium]
FSSAKNVLKMSKEMFPDVTKVIGGPHVSGDFKEVLNDLPEADFGFRGEAEIGIHGLIKHIESPGEIKLEDVQGLIYRNNGDIKYNERGVVSDLDELGIPDWDVINPREHPAGPQGTFTKRIPTAPIITTRGCPYPCTYCSASLNMGRKLRKRSAKGVVDEIELLNKKYGVEEIHISDDNFSLDRKRTMDICEMILDRNLDICWSVTNGVRLDSLDAELLKKMEKSGCYSFSVGIESGSPRIVKLMRRQVKVETIEEKMWLIKKATKIRVTGFFIMGYPTETLDELKMSLALSLKLPLSRGQYSNFIPLPGTQAFNFLIESGEIKRSEIEWDSFQLYRNTYYPKTMTNRQLRRFIAKSFLRFYLRPGIIWGVIREINSFTQLRFVFRRVLDIFH